MRSSLSGCVSVMVACPIGHSDSVAGFEFLHSFEGHFRYLGSPIAENPFLRLAAEVGVGLLDPAEHDVVRLVCEGLGNKEAAARLFVSPRTVQAHLAHVYTKLGINSRVQLVQEVSRRAQTSAG